MLIPKDEGSHMTGKGWTSAMARRWFLSRLGMGAGVVGAGVVGAGVMGSSAADLQASAEPAWKPARHTQDDWYDKIPGVHRFVIDSSSAEGFGWALWFAGNYYAASQDSYGLKDSDLALVIVARHKSTSFAYSDAIWTKWGKQLSEQAEFVDPKTKEPPKANWYAGPGDGSQLSGKMDPLVKRGVQFAVCSMSTRAIATRIAKANGLEVDTIIKEITSNLVPNARMVPAGVVAVNRAQEHGYSFIFAV
jgi:intracellular sulfur oxidation DsrE/DsrF family protein